MILPTVVLRLLFATVPAHARALATAHLACQVRARRLRKPCIAVATAWLLVGFTAPVVRPDSVPFDAASAAPTNGLTDELKRFMETRALLPPADGLSDVSTIQTSVGAECFTTDADCLFRTGVDTVQSIREYIVLDLGGGGPFEESQPVERATADANVATPSGPPGPEAR
jgi:hypothetical protein